MASDNVFRNKCCNFLFMCFRQIVSLVLSFFCCNVSLIELAAIIKMKINIVYKYNK